MNDEIPSIINHVSIGTNRLDEAIEFYDAVLATVGASRQHEVPDFAVAYGKFFPEFWVQRPFNGESASTANGAHFSFLALSRAIVDEFYQVALEAGGTCAGPPGLRPDYGPDYYAAYVYDLDGHKIEANVIPGLE
ncbi:MAG: VOC family protein [Gammaproteobacteria bacterium]|nr:VOC family protein [Gammaproteobacteria bacterium]